VSGGVDGGNLLGDADSVAGPVSGDVAVRVVKAGGNSCLEDGNGEGDVVVRVVKAGGNPCPFAKAGDWACHCSKCPTWEPLRTESDSFAATHPASPCGGYIVIQGSDLSGFARHTDVDLPDVAFDMSKRFKRRERLAVRAIKGKWDGARAHRELLVELEHTELVNEQYLKEARSDFRGKGDSANPASEAGGVPAVFGGSGPPVSVPVMYGAVSELSGQGGEDMSFSLGRGDGEEFSVWSPAVGDEINALLNQDTERLADGMAGLQVVSSDDGSDSRTPQGRGRPAADVSRPAVDEAMQARAKAFFGKLSPDSRTAMEKAVTEPKRRFKERLALAKATVQKNPVEMRRRPKPKSKRSGNGGWTDWS
jgi:hypothetical protein